ncbi:hypothetical protein HDU76_005366, partial [Blyttiomyces sp. JEL0837]
MRHTSTLLTLVTITCTATLSQAATGTDPVGLVNQLIDQIPACAKTCLTSIPGITLPATLAEIQSVCNNLNADIAIFDPCVKTGCTAAADLQTATQLEGQLQAGCSLILSTTQNTTSSGAMSATSSMMTTSATVANAGSKNGASRREVDLRVLVAGLLGGVGVLVGVM